MVALDLLPLYTARHNAGLGGKWATTLPDLFNRDAEMVFVGLPQAPARGLPAILAAFEAHPPTEAFALLGTSEAGRTAMATYAWDSTRDIPAGTLVLEADGEKINRLVISGRPPESSQGDPVQVALELARTRYSGCEAIFLAGSVVRGEATTSSDLDLVVVYKSLERAYRESYVVDGWPVEAFVHDPETLAYFFWKVDRPSGRPSLPAMVREGIALPASTPLTCELQAAARELLAAGPDSLGIEDLRHLRYAITDKLDDLRGARNQAELGAIAAHLYGDLADFVLRARGRWSASGKTIPRELAALEPDFAKRFADAFAEVFTNARPDRLLALADEILAPYGGGCFEGYRREAPPEWRSPLPAQQQTTSMGDAAMPQLGCETSRLILRPFTLADAQDVQRLAGDREIASTTLLIPHPYEDGMAEAWICTHPASFASGKGVTFALTLKSDGSLVGAISLAINKAHECAELGYWIGKPFWGQGYCTEAARAVIRYVFETLSLNRIFAGHLSRNPASGKVMQKAGMTHEGRLRQAVKKWGVFEDLERYSVLRDDWQSGNATPSSKATAIVHMFDHGMPPDEAFVPGKPNLLAPGNKGRILDPRRTPVQIEGREDDTGFFLCRVLAFEDQGALWRLPFESMSHFQFEATAKSVADGELQMIEERIAELDRELDIPCNPDRAGNTAVLLAASMERAGRWLDLESAFFRKGRVLPLGQRTGDVDLRHDLEAYMAELGLGHLEGTFASQFASNPGSGEAIKGHCIVLAELGLVPFRGKIVRDRRTFEGEWSREQRTEHILARLGFVAAVFRKAGFERTTLYRGVWTPGRLGPHGSRTFVSATFDEAVARSLFAPGSTESGTGVLYRQTVPVSRLFMTYLETAALNARFLEAEAILLGDPDNPAF